MSIHSILKNYQGTVPYHPITQLLVAVLRFHQDIY